MRRNTLEAVFGALGAGLTGYGRDKREQEEMEERRRREAMQESLTAANMLATGRFGTEAQLRESGGRAFQTAGQMALGDLPGGGAKRVLPTAEDISNLGTASRRGAAPPMFDIGGQKLGVMRTAADEQREDALMKVQQAAMEREQRLADEMAKFEREQEALKKRDERLGRQRMEQIGAQSRAAGARTENRPAQRPTEAQEKSYLFSKRLEAANPVIEQYGPSANLDRISAALAASNALTRAVANRALTEEEQQLVVAIRQFAEPILRKNTGAAFNREEIGWIEQQFIPTSGDTDAVQRFKAESRLREIDGFRSLATPAAEYYESRRPQQRPPLSSFWED